MKEYAIYPFKNINITQNYNQGNHNNHWYGSTNYIDKPWDEAGIDKGREYFVPQNDFIVEEVLGINSNVTNSVRLKSVNKLYLPIGNYDYLHITLSHMNEDNLKEVKVGDILRKGTMILLEGNDGIATGNHFHITANLGKYYGFLKNSNGSWCFTYEKSLLPEEAFYVDSKFNVIVNTNGSQFIEVPSFFVGVPVEKNINVNQIEIKVNNLRCRSTPSLNGEILGYVVPGFYDYNSVVDSDGYLWYDIGIGYIAYNADWINIYPKKISDNFFSKLKKLFNKVFDFFR